MLQFTDQEAAGMIPMFLDMLDPRPAKEQLDEGYQHGGGWNPMEGWTLLNTESPANISYVGDPPMEEVSRAVLRNETIVLFDYSFVAIIQKDGSFEVARMD